MSSLGKVREGGRIFVMTEFQIYAFVGSIKTHESNNTTIFNGPNGYQITSENNITVNTEKYITQSKIISNYIFAGLGMVIVLLIFGILVHLWRKSKTLERKLVLQQISRENNGIHDLSKQNQLMIQSDSTIQSCSTEHFYRPIGTEYDEICEDIELPALSEDYEIPKALTKRSKTYFQTEDFMIKRNKQCSNLNKDILSMYPHPFFAPDVHVQNSSSPEESNLYLEVI